MHLVTFSDFTANTRPATHIASVAVWQNALLSYNLMSATIPALKGFVKGFTTGGIGYTKDMSTPSGGSGNNNDYELRSLSGSPKKVKVVPEICPKSKVRVTTKERNPKAASSRIGKITGEKTHSNKDRSASIASGNSRQILIRQDWEISRA